MGFSSGDSRHFSLWPGGRPYLLGTTSVILGGRAPQTRIRGGIMTGSQQNTFGKPVPVFRVKDVEASVDYYLKALGFKVQFRVENWFASVAREDCNIFLTSDNQSQPRMWLWVGVQDVRALHAQFVASGAKIRNPPNNFEWALEMQVEDLDGNVLRIGSDREKDQPLGVWRDADGIRWRHLGNQKYERLD